MIMETYYRKRSKKAHQPTTAKMDQCEAVQGCITAADYVPPSPSSHLLLQEMVDDGDKSQIQNHIKPGFLYEIDHSHLPPRTPVQLRSIRMAMVSEKTEANVGVRFPSMESLRAFFNYSRRETHPALDDKFVMGCALAEKVLVRLVPAEIFSERKSLESFWLISSESHRKDVVVKKKKGSCLSEELKDSGMVRWGIRRQVKYLGRHRGSDDTNAIAQNSSSSFINGDVESNLELGAASYDHERECMEEEKKTGDDDGVGGERDSNREDKDIEEEDEDEEEEENGDSHEEDDEEEEKKKIKEENKNMKRKRYSFRNMGVKKTKKEQLEMIRKQQQTQKKNQMKKKKGKMRLRDGGCIQRDPKDRWSAERYKLAEENLLGVMKMKGATAESPILRPQLRAEARKKIGDTGLLDHLLKHMAGKLAPGGQERFRRRHNPDGAMEYWLESADLVNIRKDAGVSDPYWVPPTGWKPGDSPTQDPICARELKLLKDDISIIKRDLGLMVTKMQLEEEVGRLRRELDVISSKRRQEEVGSDISQNLDLLATSLESSKSDFGDAHFTVEKYKEQLMAISDFVKEIEEKMGNLTPNVVKKARTRCPLMVGAEKRTKSKQKEQVQALNAKETSGEGQSVAAVTEEKAAKIQRLKSGFRICKPQGTFLWPNMVNNSSSMSPHQIVQLQVEVPTPPSVSSSAPPPQLPYLHHLHYQPPSLVKPLAEKRAVTLTVSTTPVVDLNTAPAVVPVPVPPLMKAHAHANSSCMSQVGGNWLALSTTLNSNSASASDHSSPPTVEL